jgi:hypothetical protein
MSISLSNVIVFSEKALHGSMRERDSGANPVIFAIQVTAIMNSGQ